MSDLHRPKRIPAFLIWGGWYGSRNIGDSAILLGLKEIIRLVNPKKDYYIRALSTDTDYTNTKGVTGRRALLKKDIFRIWPWFSILKTFREADKIVISGGTPIFDFSHAIRSFYFFLATLLRKHTVFFGIGVKPIQHWYGKKYIPFNLNKAQYISVRDQGSKEVLQSLGISNTKINLTADSAFFAPADQQEKVQEILQQYGIKPGKDFMIVAPRFLSPDQKRLYLQEYMDPEVIEQSPKKLAEVIDKMSSKFEKVVLLAMHFHGPDSDVPFIQELQKLCKSKNVVFIDQELRPETAIGIIKEAALLIGMRLHSLLLAASMSTPIVGIAYEKKVKDLFLRLELSDYCLDLFDFSAARLLTTAQKAYKERSKLSKLIAKRVAHLRELVLKGAKQALTIA